MLAPRTPVFLSHAPVPRVHHFALLAMLEAGIRGTLLSAMPLMIYRVYADAEIVSRIYLFIGIISLFVGLLVPWFSTFLPRRWMTTLGGVFYLLGCGTAALAPPAFLPAALGLNAFGTVTFSICLNAYVLDYISRSELGRNESMRMVYSAAPWAIGPITGVWLLDLWTPLPFLVGFGFGLALLVTFWRLRLGDGKQIVRARGPAANPLAYLGRFVRQPRLIAGWLFAVIRSCGWWVYVVYLPIYCIENGLGDRAGAVALSLSNGLLITTPLMLRVVQRLGVRGGVRASFALCATLFLAAWVLSGSPWIAYFSLMLASILLVALDVCGSLPFLMAVKPSERTGMSAVYSSYRDVSGILTPAVAWAVLLVAPVAGVFGACGLAMLGAAHIATKLHPRLGEAKTISAGHQKVTVR